MSRHFAKDRSCPNLNCALPTWQQQFPDEAPPPVPSPDAHLAATSPVLVMEGCALGLAGV